MEGYLDTTLKQIYVHGVRTQLILIQNFSSSIYWDKDKKIPVLGYVTQLAPNIVTVGTSKPQHCM